MIGRAASAAAGFAARLAFYAALFCVVIVAQAALSDAFVAAGLAPPRALLAAGFIILIVVVSLLALSRLRKKPVSRAKLRRALGAPEGDYCVLGSAQGAPSGWRFRATPKPRYPKEAFAARVGGLAMLTCGVDEKGRAHDIVCVLSWPSLGFYQAAERALRQARFVAVGQTRADRVEVAFTFRVRTGLLGLRSVNNQTS